MPRFMRTQEFLHKYFNVLRKIDMQTYLANPDRYELRTGSETGAPSCPYGNHYQWIGYDRDQDQYVRFTKSVFKKLIGAKQDQ